MANSNPKKRIDKSGYRSSNDERSPEIEEKDRINLNAVHSE